MNARASSRASSILFKSARRVTIIALRASASLAAARRVGRNSVSDPIPFPSPASSDDEKLARLKELVGKAHARERPILLRLLHNELRIGLHDGLIQEAIARASDADLKTVRREQTAERAVWSPK